MSEHPLPLLPAQILEKALEQERAAHAFYAKTAAECTVSFMKDLLIGLRDEEANHVKMIQNMLIQLRAGGTPRLPKH